MPYAMMIYNISIEIDFTCQSISVLGYQQFLFYLQILQKICGLFQVLLQSKPITRSHGGNKTISDHTQKLNQTATREPNDAFNQKFSFPPLFVPLSIRYDVILVHFSFLMFPFATCRIEQTLQAVELKINYVTCY